MPKITRFPPFGKRFFRLARKLIGSCQFQHFWRMVLAVAGMHGRRSLQRIEALTDKQRTRQAISHFLTCAEWDAPVLLWETAIDTLKQLGYRPGDTIHLILDDTQKRKRGKRMDAVSKIFLHAEKVYANGHTLLGAALVYRNVVIPCAARLWAARARCKEGLAAEPGKPLEFRKLTQLAGDVIDEARLRLPDAKMIVLFDAYYLCPAVTEACARTKSRYIGVAKKNRNFAPDGRPRDRRKLSQYGANVLARDGKATAVRGKKHRLAQRVGWLSKGDTSSWCSAGGRGRKPGWRWPPTNRAGRPRPSWIII
jgi:SRSO17 transposase